VTARCNLSILEQPATSKSFLENSLNIQGAYIFRMDEPDGTEDEGEDHRGVNPFSRRNRAKRTLDPLSRTDDLELRHLRADMITLKQQKVEVEIEENRRKAEELRQIRSGETQRRAQEEKTTNDTIAAITRVAIDKDQEADSWRTNYEKIASKAVELAIENRLWRDRSTGRPTTRNSAQLKPKGPRTNPQPRPARPEIVSATQNDHGQKGSKNKGAESKVKVDKVLSLEEAVDKLAKGELATDTLELVVVKKESDGRERTIPVTIRRSPQSPGGFSLEEHYDKSEYSTS
jgi:hypothetical protein